jgi:hypothetical protein
MRDSHRERLAALGRPAPSVRHEAEWAAAFVEASVTDRAELPQACDEQRGAQDQLRMFGQPGEGIDRRVDPTIEYPSSDAEPVQTTR